MSYFYLIPGLIQVQTALSELQRDWAREATVPTVLKIVEEHGGGFGAVLRVGSGSCSACKEGSR
jgi:hypothetical protein